MSSIGRVESLWRYPVKSMRGEEVEEVFFGYSGVYGDRLFALKSSACPDGFPYLTGRESKELLRYRPRFRDPVRATKPPHLEEAEKIAPGLNPAFGDASDLLVEVETPEGEVLAVEDPELLRRVGKGIPDRHVLELRRSERAMTDCRPISLFSVQTVGQLAEDLGMQMDPRRFRANVYLDLSSGEEFPEDDLVGRSLQIGPRVVVSVLERDPRCKMVTLDPETGEPSPEVLRHIAQDRGGMAGVYGAVLMEGVVRRGDPVEVL